MDQIESISLGVAPRRDDVGGARGLPERAPCAALPAGGEAVVRFGALRAPWHLEGITVEQWRTDYKLLEQHKRAIVNHLRTLQRMGADSDKRG
ncbi:hypothetical protein BE20_14455 [Sorangium cellulosum]|uniref:Uncharacterized protein n=1 Tax=Sorangium cellulosum TaxID=56 RepID=A0A150T2N1_SORCE|nr:hypothetical protein BE20_14455 [Sorangium cellulosum]KYF98960.1 hypothetical protein BE18_36015 [Sorangium cellulosum]